MAPAVPSRAPIEAEFGRYAPSAHLARLIAATRACGMGWAGSRRAFALRKVAQKIAGPAALDVETFGMRMRLTAADNSSEKRLLYTPQYVDPVERGILDARLPCDGVFVDVGANVGAFSLFVAAQRPRGLVVAVEPQAEICARLAFHVRVNASCAIRVAECALADREGDAELFVDPRDKARASIRMLGGDGAQERRRVPATTLAALCRQERIEKIDALKIDAGGADDLILDAFFATAPKRMRPATLIVDATTPASASLAPRLAAIGYRALARTRANHVFELREV
ncbi:MAG: FkbM family methyltransferase [Rhodoblastus sp.]|nr:MAG: FkbM family methyltransferase [Rhodoblastus sp.]